MPKVPIDKLRDAVNKELEKWAKDETATVEEITRTLGKKGAQGARQASAGAYGGGKYASGWTVTMETERLGTTAIIHNKTPGLPHLLENGHAKRGGGRVPGRVHLAPVEEELVKAFQKALEERL